MYEAEDRQVIKSIPQDQLDQVVNRRLGVRGTGKLDSGNPLDLTKSFTYGSSIEMPKYIKLPGPGAMPQPSGVGRFNGTMAQFVQAMSQPTRAMNMVCPAPGKRAEYARFKLPTGLKVTSLPRAVKQDSRFGGYVSTYEQQGDVIVSTRTLTLDYPGPICSPDDYKELRDLASAMRQDSMSPILYE